jgi:hypothetical protein
MTQEAYASVVGLNSLTMVNIDVKMLKKQRWIEGFLIQPLSLRVARAALA